MTSWPSTAVARLPVRIAHLPRLTRKVHGRRPRGPAVPGLPLVPSRSALGGFALLAFLLVLVGTVLYFSFAAGRLAPGEQLMIQAVAAAVLAALGGLAWWLSRGRSSRDRPPG